VSNLRAEIVRAHRDVANAVAGAESRLRALQAQYRTSGALIERVGGTCELIDRGPVSSSLSRSAADRSPRNATSSARSVSRRVVPRRPYWYLGEPKPWEL
jgi:hypothetical protein